jgi:hypothetical protein
MPNPHHVVERNGKTAWTAQGKTYLLEHYRTRD